MRKWLYRISMTVCIFVFGLAFCLAAAACGDTEKGTFSLDKSSLEIEEGKTAVLTPEYDNFKDLDESSLSVKWSSSASAVAAVNGGNIIGVTEGNATITAFVTIENTDYEASCNITVISSAEGENYTVSFALDETALSLIEGETKTLLPQASVTQDGEAVPVPDVVWSSSDTSVATVSGGKVEAVSEGNTKITAAITVGNTEYTAVCAVSVISPPKAEISLDQASVAMDAGTEITLGAVVVDPEGNPISDAIIEWNSSDERVVSVENGIVRGIEGGAAVVTASVVVEDDKYIANCDVTVSNKYTVNVFRPKEEEHALTYLFSDGKTTLSELAENFEIDVERNGVKLTDYASYTILEALVVSGKDVLTVSDEEIIFSNTGETEIALQLIDKTTGEEIARADTEFIVCDQIISSAEEFLALDGGDKYYALGADLDFEKIPYSLGTPEAGITLAGTFNGNGYSVSNILFRTGGYDDSALFNIIDGGTVKNLSLTVSYGELLGLEGWMYRFGPVALSAKNNATIENCFVQATYTSSSNPPANHGITGLIGYPDGNIVVRDTIISVIAPQQTNYVFAVTNDGGWNGYYTIDNVFVYRSGENIVVFGKNGDLTEEASYYCFTGGRDGVTAEKARTNLLIKAQSEKISTFVCGQFQGASLYEYGEIFFDADNSYEVRAGETIELSVSAWDLLENTEILSENIVWSSNDPNVATVSGGVVKGISEGQAEISAKVTVAEKTYTAKCTITVLKKADVYEIELSFPNATYDFEAGGNYTTEFFALTATATKNGEPWEDWRQYVALSADDATLIAFDGDKLVISGEGNTTIWANFNYESVTATASATVRIWTEIIENADEFLALGAYQNGEIADWDGRYLLANDLDFTGKTVVALGNLSGFLDGGGHALKHIQLAATGYDTVADDASKTAEGDDRFLFYIVSGTIENISITVTLGGENGVYEASAGLCYQLDGKLINSTLNVQFQSKSNPPQTHNKTGAVCVYAGWQSETMNCTINVGWIIMDWGVGGQYVTVNDRGFGYCYHAWGTNSAKLTNTIINSTAYILYANNEANLVVSGSSIAQSDSAYISVEEMKKIFT